MIHHESSSMSEQSGRPIQFLCRYSRTDPDANQQKNWKFTGREKLCPWSPVSLFTYRIVFCFVLFILCSIWFRFISILGPLRRLKKIIFDVLIKWVIIFVMSHFYVGATKMSHFLTWTCLVGAVPFLFLLFGRVELESDAATETGDSETRFWASLISSPISSVVEASVWKFQITVRVFLHRMSNDSESTK